METTVKKREWVKDAAIIFLAVLLVLTFFSNTIMNHSLPEVASAAVGSGNIIARVRGTGTVTATGKQSVKARETRTIRAVMVKVGQEINVGDVLFVLGEGDETELEQAKEKLRSLQYDYQRTALNVPVHDFSSRDSAVNNAYERLVRAQDAYNNASNVYYNAVAALSPQIESVNNEIAYVERQLTEIGAQLNDEQAKYDLRHEEAWNRVIEAQNIFDNAYMNGQSGGSSYYGAESDEYMYEEGSEYTDTSYSDTTTGSVFPEAEWEALEEAKRQLENIENDTYLSSLKSQYQTLLDRYETLNKHRDGLTPSQASSYKDALDEAESELYYAQVSYDEAINARNYAYQTFEQETAVAGVNLQEIAANIAIQQEKIKNLAGSDDNYITAGVSGTIDTIDCTAGDTVTKDTLLCTIEVPDMGHTLSFSVTNDQAQRLRIGDTATISNYYWGNSVTATLTTIRTDPKNPQSNKVLTFDLVGDVTSGAEMTISVGQKSASYDLVVPNSAIKSDTNGSFVLLISVKSSPLGNRYTAKRVSVEVLASDDSNSAIVADLNNGDYVITTSSAPVSNGDMVRMADNQT